MTDPAPVERLVGVSLNAAIDKIAAVDHLEPGRIHRPEMLAAVPGGKALNAVRVARQLGAMADVVAVIAGYAGEWVATGLEARGIRGWFVRADGETRTCLSILDRSTGALTEFYEAGFRWDDDRQPALEAALRDALAVEPSGAVVLLAGSLPHGMPDGAYRRLAELATEAGARVAVDVGGAPLAAALQARPWLVKINAAEASQTTGVQVTDRSAAVTAAQRLMDLGAEHALITMGVAGAVLIAPDRTWHVGPPPEIGPYSVGSGDALIGGFIAALARGAGLADAVRYGSAAAASSALVPGQGELDPGDVERLMSRCVVRQG